MIKRLLYISLLLFFSCTKETSLASGTSASQIDVKEYLLSVTGCPNGSGCNGWVGISFPELGQTVQGREAIVGSLPDGTKVTEMNERNYLDCFLNNKMNLTREIIQRMGDVFATWKRLDGLWKRTNCRLRLNL